MTQRHDNARVPSRRGAAPDAVRRTRRLAAKVPAITAFFWITKVLTTGMGESMSDYLVHSFDPVLAVGIAGVALVAVLSLQLSTRRYVAWIYWLAVAMVSVFGTMAADVLHVGLGIPYTVSTAFFSIVLIAIFVVWYASEKTLSIHSIDTRRREAFYWLTVLTTFALGTSAGDLTASTMHLGYLVSGVVFAVLIALPLLAFWRFRLNATLAFWFAYILTRPLGASFADWTAVVHSRGGLGLGDGPVTFVLAILIVGSVVYLAVSRRDVQRAVRTSLAE